MDIVQDAALRDRDLAEVLGEFLVVADRQLELTRADPTALVIPRLRLSLHGTSFTLTSSPGTARGAVPVPCLPAGRVARELEGLGGQILEDGSKVDRRARADARRVPG